MPVVNAKGYPETKIGGNIHWILFVKLFREIGPKAAPKQNQPHYISGLRNDPAIGSILQNNPVVLFAGKPGLIRMIRPGVQFNEAPQRKSDMATFQSWIFKTGIEINGYDLPRKSFVNLDLRIGLNLYAS